tara:strand:- start:2686 stop:3360 length:675 start_codon:yes stop_codon:yes gene_type:complete
MIKLSQTLKIKARSWSIEAGMPSKGGTCPASIDPNTGEFVDACKGCYAMAGNYRFPNVKAPRIHNKEDWKRDAWVSDMVAELDNDRYFRWFDSGDMYDIRLAKKMLQVMELTPHCNYWLPTRMHKFNKFMPVINAMQALPNVVVRLSSDSVQGGIIDTKLPNSTIIPTIEQATSAMTICHAYDNDGKCGSCRACWSKDVKTVAYVAHGRSMAKVIRLIDLKEAA